MLVHCCTDSADSLGLRHGLTAPFVTELEESLTTALGHNDDTLQGIIIHRIPVRLVCDPVVCKLTIN